MKKDTVTRKNCVDGSIYPASQLIRFAIFKDKTIHFDPEQKLGGRGGYCLNDPESIAICFRRKLLNRAFKLNIDQETYTKLQEEVSKWLSNQKENQI